MQARSEVCAACSLPQDTGGEKNPNWRGGKTNQQGYIMRLVDGKYIMEHRLVMEKHLRRALCPTETVHHLNGVRDDNRIANLELWTKPHPTGIRQSDAIAWAKEILAREEGARTEFDHMRGLAFV